MRRKRFAFPLFLALLASLFIAPSALSLYLVNQALGSVDFDIAKENERAVAVIGSDMNAYYASVEGALRAASAKGGSQTVYVLPGISSDSNPIVIDENCTVSSGVTLSLPYAQSGTTFTTGFEDGTSYVEGQSDFGDSTPSKVGTNQKTLVVLGEGKKMTIEAGGSLVIGGQLGTAGGGQNAFGMTYGNYAELAMASGSSIDCLGNIDVRGYIKPWDEGENDSCSIMFGDAGGSRASLSIPLVLYDFPGGTDGLSGTGTQLFPSTWNGSIVSGVFPFEMYDLPNVSVPFRTYYGSTIDCPYAFVTGGMVAGGNLNLLGNANAIITLEKAGSYIELDYDPAATYRAENVLSDATSSGSEGSSSPTVQRGLTLNDPRILNGSASWPSHKGDDGDEIIQVADSRMARTKLEIFGNARTNEISVSLRLLISVEINTEGGSTSGLDYDPLAFPFSYKWVVTVANGGTVSVQNQLKFLPGSSLTIEEGGTLDISSGKTIAGVDATKTGGKRISRYYPTSDRNGNAIDKPTIVNNGSIIVREGASLGATITSERAGAQINFMGGATPESTRVEAFELNFLAEAGEYGGYFFDAEAYIGTNAESASLLTFAGRGSAFESEEGGAGGFYYAVAPALLTIEDNGLSGFEVLVDGTPLDYQPNLGVELVSGATVRVRYPKTNASIGSISLNGSSLALQYDGTYLYAEFQASGSLTLSVNPVQWITIESTEVSIFYEGDRDDHDPYGFSLDWSIYDAVGDDIDSGTVSIDSGATYATLGNEFPSQVQLGWQLAITISGDLKGDKATVSSINGQSGGEYTFQSTDKTIPISIGYSVVAGECIVEGTLIDMADGSSKKVEDLEVGDMVMAFDHETGKEVASPILCVYSDPRMDYEVVYLTFSDGSRIGLVYEHGLFDRTLNQYVYFTPETAESYIGHEFYGLGERSLTLEKVEIRRETVAVYSPVTVMNLNLFHEGLLGITGGIEGLFNIFDLDEDMAYDPVKKAADIEKYGLFTYEEWEGLISEEAFNLLPIPYLKVSMGKGLLGWEDIYRMVDRFGDLLPQ